MSDMALEFILAATVVIVAFLPSVIYMIIVRNTERYQREPWRAVIKSFMWGATFGVIIAAIIEIILVYFYAESFHLLRSYEFLAEHKESLNAIVIAVIIAPFVEEATKAYGIITSRKYVDEPEDGFVYGASSGFGFAATENLLYEVSALLTGGIIAWAIVAIIRSISSALLHGSATAMTGFGYSSKKILGRSSMGKGYLVAVSMHATFNILASLPIILGLKAVEAYGILLLIAIIYATMAFKYIRRKIRYYDRLPRPR